MPDISLAQICNAIETTLGAASGMDGTQSYDELAEGLHSADLPLLQIYPQSGDCDPGGTTDRTTYGGDVRQKRMLFHADLYARQRSHLDEDMSAATDMIEAITDVLETQNAQPYFGLAGIQSFSWRWERTVFIYTDDVKFMGARFFITIWVY